MYVIALSPILRHQKHRAERTTSRGLCVVLASPDDHDFMIRWPARLHTQLHALCFNSSPIIEALKYCECDIPEYGWVRNTFGYGGVRRRSMALRSIALLYCRRQALPSA